MAWYNLGVETQETGAILFNRQPSLWYSSIAPAVWASAPRLRLDNDGTQREFSMDNKGCECGCGQTPKPSRRFITGHNAKTPEMRLAVGERNKVRKISEETRAKYKLRKRPPITDELRAKLSAANKGRKQTPEWRAKISAARKEYRHSAETKNKMRASAHRGPEHHNWTGASRLYPGDWSRTAREIRKRDSNTCMECSTRNFFPFRAADVHHIDGRKDNCQADNLICLCRSCHKHIEYAREEHARRLHTILSERYGYTYD